VFHNRQGEGRQLRLFHDDEHVGLPDDPDVVRISLKSVGWANPRPFGDVWLGLWLWRHLNLDEIVERHIPSGKETISLADVVAIEVINRLCAPCSELALAEHWYASTGLEDLLGVPDSAVTKDRLYRTLDRLLRVKEAIERDLKEQLGTLFQLDYSLVLYDLTSTYFEGMAAENELARRGYSRDHRADCKQIVVALVVTRYGFPLALRTFAGNTRDLKTVQSIVTEIEAQFGKTQRIWVMDRGMISDEPLRFLAESGQQYLLATQRGELAEFQAKLGKEGWKRLPKNSQVEVKLFKREDVHYLLARSRPRRKKERAIRRH
jgi:transposase